jgi:Putative  PD-(D/E)XK family member, (DUF4420)
MLRLKNDDIWRELASGNGLRVNENGKFDFFWAVLEDASPALVLFLPELPAGSEHLPYFRNLEVGYRILNRPAFYLKLMDGAQREIFHTLCNDVVNSAEKASTLPDAIDCAIKRTRRWHFLLKSGSLAGLSVEEQRGLVGELAFLGELCAEIGPLGAIEAWRGPLGASKDFEFPQVCIEIKSRRSAAKPKVSISSIDQLADVDGANLFLRVYNVDNHSSDVGDSLHDHVNRVGKLFEEHDASYNIWQDRIYATGYSQDEDYGQLKWAVGAVRTYEVKSDFPRLVPPLPDGVENLTYSVSLAACEPFVVPNENASHTAKGQENG